MMRSLPSFGHTLISGTTVAVVLLLGACGTDDASTDEPLPPAAELGRSVMRANGCGACHGADGQGGVGPTFVGLYGSEVELSDGSVVIADDEYLRRSITDPRDQVVEGYNVPMPTNDLDDDEIEQIIDFILEIGPGAGTSEDDS